MTALVVARALHYAAIVQAFGALAFVVAIGAPASANRAVSRLVGWSVAVAIASWLAWLALQASAIASLPLPAAIAPALLARVVADTSFGRAWLVRFTLLAALALSVGVRRDRASRATDAVATLIAALAIASLAAIGHAAATPGASRPLHVAADALHLVAAGAWVGALLPLAVALHASIDAHAAFDAARRFSRIGIACVVALIATGAVNATMLVARWPALFGTAYGQLLIAKLALLAAMLVLAAWNRQRATPRMTQREGRRAAIAVARNARTEAALGTAVLAIVAVLGTRVPAAHDDVRWPFPFRITTSGGVPRVARAYPTTYMRVPIPYDVDTVARGATVYASHCARCHGADGRGDGQDASTLAAAHVLDHGDGDLYWWITHGIAGTPMPPFGDVLDERARFDVLHYAKTLAAASLLADGAATQAPAAPQFTYQIDSGAQQAVAPRAPFVTLVVLYTMPASRERLVALANGLPALARAQIRVAAVPMGDVASSADPRVASIDATVSPAVAQAYRVLASGSPHAEFVADRDARLRARWTLPALPAVDEIVRDVGTLPPASANANDHMH